MRKFSNGKGRGEFCQQFTGTGATLHITIQNGGTIFSNTFADGSAGNVEVSAGALLIDRQGAGSTGISSEALTESTGNAGSVVDIVGTERAMFELDGANIIQSAFEEGARFAGLSCRRYLQITP